MATKTVTRVNVYGGGGEWYYAAWCGDEFDHSDNFDASEEFEALREAAAMFGEAEICRVPDLPAE